MKKNMPVKEAEAKNREKKDREREKENKINTKRFMGEDKEQQTIKGSHRERVHRGSEGTHMILGAQETERKGRAAA